MAKVSIERQALIDKFFQIIRKLSRNRTTIDIVEVMNFFNLISETANFTPPTVEFMTILKNYRPLLYQEYKLSLIPKTRMHSLAYTEFDLGQAIINLGITDVHQLRRMVKGE